MSVLKIKNYLHTYLLTYYAMTAECVLMTDVECVAAVKQYGCCCNCRGDLTLQLLQYLQ